MLRQLLFVGIMVAGLGRITSKPAFADPKPAKPAPAAKAAPKGPQAPQAHQAPKAPQAPQASGPVKAFKGPEGELVVMVEANDGKEMFVHLKNLGGDLEGKTLLYLLEDRGEGNKDVYLTKKRGSKTYRSYLLTSRDGRWDFYHPTNAKVQLSLRYSEEASAKIKLDEVLAGYKP